MPITNQANLEKRLQIVFDNQPLDPVISYLLDRADTLIIDYLGYDPTQAAKTETWDGGTRSIVPTEPIVSVTTLTEDAVALVEDTDFKVDLAAGIIRRIWSADLKSKMRFKPGYQNIVLTYQGGFAAVPSLLVVVATDMVAREFMDGATNASAAGSGDTTREVIGEYEVSYREGRLRVGLPTIQAEDRMRLARYRRYEFA